MTVILTEKPSAAKNMQQIGEFKLSPERVLAGIDELILHDMDVMKSNKTKIGTGTTPPKEANLPKRNVKHFWLEKR